MTFVVFLLYQLSEAWHMIPSKVYERLKEADVIDGYILPCYDTLHTLGAQYLVEDLTDLVQERGVKIMSEYDMDIIYKQNLEQDIIVYLAQIKEIPIIDAMDIYYRSKLSQQIQKGEYGIENLDYKYLTEDLIENEPDLF